MKEGHHTGSALIADRDLENIMTFVFSGFSFILHLAHTLPVCQGPSADIPLLNQRLDAFIIHFILASFTCAHSA